MHDLAAAVANLVRRHLTELPQIHSRARDKFPRHRYSLAHTFIASTFTTDLREPHVFTAP